MWPWFTEVYMLDKNKDFMRISFPKQELDLCSIVLKVELDQMNRLRFKKRQTMVQTNDF